MKLNPFKDFQSDQIQRSPCKIFTAHYACRNAALNLTPVTGTTNGFIFKIINSLIESWGVRLTWFDCNVHKEDKWASPLGHSWSHGNCRWWYTINKHSLMSHGWPLFKRCPMFSTIVGGASCRMPLQSWETTNHFVGQGQGYVLTRVALSEAVLIMYLNGVWIKMIDDVTLDI